MITNSISLCSSMVYIGTNSYPFHVEDINQIDATATRFCVTHGVVDKTECNRVVENHRQHCFPVVPSSTDEKNATSEGPIPSPISAPEDPTIIDYSTRVGPVLTIYHGEKTTNLQSYKGETIAQTLTRSCAMLKFTEAQCAQVDVAYRKLMQDETTISAAVGDNNSQTAGNDKEVNEGVCGMDEQQESRGDTPGLFQTLYQEGTAVADKIHQMITAYWKWILLIVGVFYVYLEGHPIDGE